MEVEPWDKLVEGGSGSGIRIESSPAAPRRADSSEQLASFTSIGFDRCQHKLVTASELL
jgi:hypothetical protein